MQIIKKITSLIIGMLLLTSLAFSAPNKDYWEKWAAFNPLSTQTISYTAWQQFLDKYVISKEGQTYLEYKKVTKDNKKELQHAIKLLAQLPITNYNRDEQLAYWINLYNMLTVEVILNNPTITSITQIDKNWFGQSKIWDTPIITVDQTALTLNDIEHRILRPIWNDPRIHAAINCASISCPNLNPAIYDAQDINNQLNNAFTLFINSPKGLIVKGNTLVLSKLFDWYGNDFGTQGEMLKFISYYIKNAKIKALLNQVDIKLSYQGYDWKLNTLPLE